jgi:RNA polymerase sigma-70 factor
MWQFAPCPSPAAAVPTTILGGQPRISARWRRQALPTPTAKDVFEILVREHADMLTSYLRGALGISTAVDDIFQETMLVAWRRLSEYDKSRPFGPWLRGIARNLLLEYFRKRKAAPLAADPDSLDEVDRHYEGFMKPGDIYGERAERLATCVERLPESLRSVIDLAYVRGMMLTEIAQSLGVNEEAVKKRVQRARLMLAQCIQGGTPEGSGGIGEVAS